MLDPSGRKEVIDTIMKLNREEGITIVLITHNMDEAVKADRIVVIDNGVIKADGTPKEVFADAEKIKSLKLDVPQSTDLINELKLKTDETVLSAGECAEILYKELV